MFTGYRFSKNSINLMRQGYSVRQLNEHQKNIAKYDIEEVKIPVPWGHIAGKWWGDRNIHPVLAIHGWQDNANSFDKLIPLLNMPSVLAIDLPGHGLSSHIPTGKMYDIREHLTILHRIKKYFNWEKMPLLTHSFGSALGFLYSSIFPNEVKWLVNIECARALITVFQMDLSTLISKGIDLSLKIEKQKMETALPAYKLSKMIHMTIEGSLGSISTPEAALILLRRGICLSEQPPESEKNKEILFKSDLQDFIKYDQIKAQSLNAEEQKQYKEFNLSVFKLLEKAREQIKNFHLNEYEDKYYVFLRDPSIKAQTFQNLNEDILLEASKNIKCPVLSIRAKSGFLCGSTKKLYENTLDILKANSNYFEHHEVNGSHHIHLNTPEILAQILNNFLQKCKWWGPRERRPILCLHGWQDNANTFDTLIPYLLPEFSYLAIDLPGHGFSSHFPPGLFYGTHECLTVLRRIQLQFKWPKVSLIGHSFGAACGFLFSSCFSENVDFLIGIDILKPLSRNASENLKKMSEATEKIISYESKNADTAPLYNKTDLLKRWIKGSNDSVTEKSCHILMQRGTEEKNGLYRLTRDYRVKISLNSSYTQRENLKLAENISCNVLFVKAKGSPYYDKKEDVLNVMNVIKLKAKHFECHELPGTHHIHLNNPEIVAPVINSFIETVKGQQQL